MNQKTENVQVEIHSLHSQRQQIMRECDGLKDEIGRLKGLLEVAEANLDADEERSRVTKGGGKVPGIRACIGKSEAKY